MIDPRSTPGFSGDRKPVTGEITSENLHELSARSAIAQAAKQDILAEAQPRPIEGFFRDRGSDLQQQAGSQKPGCRPHQSSPQGQEAGRFRPAGNTVSSSPQATSSWNWTRPLVPERSAPSKRVR